MKHKLLLSAMLAGAMTAGFATAAQATEKEKCYGIAKAGQNDCASADGANSCAGHAKTDNDPNQWKLVEKGMCEEMGGTQTPAVEKK